MRLLKSLFCLLSALAYMQQAGSQSAALNQIQEKWAVYQNSTLQEKIYLHTDKIAYVAGEIIWFKIYNVDAATHKPLPLSKVAYVEVLDSANRFLAQVKIGMKEGRGNGSVFLPLNISSGHYKLRAYTNWMKNFGAAHFFEKPLTIINTLKNLNVVSADTAQGFELALFPEGGNLVIGIESKVGVKLTGRDGKGVHFSGKVFNEAGDTVTTIEALKFGIGNFLITPYQDQKYTVALTLPSGRTLTKNLPAAYGQGYAMRVRNASNQLQITVGVSAASNNEGVYLFAHNRYKLFLAEEKTFQNGVVQFGIDTAKLPEGISQFTVFNSAKKPVCERLYFKKPVQKILLQTRSDQPQYGTRKPVNLSITASGLADSGLIDLSLSVYKTDALQDAGNVNILNYLWLASELTGRVEAPEFYFSNDTQADAAADNLMLTHGWRRFRWETILEDAPAAFRFPAEYNGHLVKAAITDSRTGKPAPHVHTFLSIPGNPFQFYAAQSDSTGIAQFDVKSYFGSGETILQTNVQYDSTYRITIESPFIQQFSSDALPSFSVPRLVNEPLLQRSIGMQVQNIYNKDSLALFQVPEVYDTIPFYGQPDYEYKLDVYTRFATMEEVLREYVRPINVVQRRGGLHLLMLDEPRRQFFDGGELVLVDGIPLFKKNNIFAYDPMKVRKLDVVPRKYFLGPAMFNGIASFTTYNGNHEGLQLDPRAVIIDYEGLQLEREFYAPVYETPQQYENRKPDFRSTLLWKPNIKAGKADPASVRFFTSDEKGRYVVVIEGLDNNGNAAVTHFPVEVK